MINHKRYENHDHNNHEDNINHTNKENTEKIKEKLESDIKKQEDNPLAWRPGKKLKDYMIEKEIGTGGFGITFLAQTRNHKKVVIKTLKKYERDNPEDKKNKDDFVNEGMRLARCDHPHIVKVKDYFSLDNDLPCIVMEYIEGENLQYWLRNPRNVLTESESILFIQQIGDALSYIHSFQPILLHRDVNPKNIIRRIKDNNEAEVILIDFGIARNADDTEQREFTKLATTGFAPTEQSHGKPQGPYTDVYALAATLYFMLTKKPPINASTRVYNKAETQQDNLVSPQVFNPNISDKLNQAIIWGMELFAKDRPQSVQEWLDALPQPQNKKSTTIPSIKKIKNLPQNHQNKIDSPVISKPVVEQAKTKENQQPPQNPLNSPENNNDWSLYARTFLMGAGIWLIVITFLPETAIDHKGIWIGIGICLWGIALFFKSRLSLGQKLMQHIFSLIACCLIYLLVSTNIITNISADYLAPIVGILTMIMIAIAELFIIED